MVINCLILGLFFQANGPVSAPPDAKTNTALSRAEWREQQLKWELARAKDRLAQSKTWHALDKRIDANRQTLNAGQTIFGWALGGGFFGFMAVVISTRRWFKNHLAAIANDLRGQVFEDMRHLQSQVDILELDERIRKSWSLLILYQGRASEAAACLLEQGFRNLESIKIDNHQAGDAALPEYFEEHRFDMIVFDHVAGSWVNDYALSSQKPAFAGYYTRGRCKDLNCQDRTNFANSRIVLPTRVLETGRFLSAIRGIPEGRRPSEQSVNRDSNAGDASVVSLEQP